MNEFNPEAAAEAQSQPGTFSFVERLQGRGFPTSKVKVYLDEANGFKRTQLAIKAESPGLKPEEKVALEKQIEELDAVIAQSRYIFELHGFDPDRYDEVIDEAYEQFPAEYEVSLNPFSGAKTKEEVDNPDRSEYLLAALWRESIKKITDANGNEDTSPLDFDTAFRMRQTFPIDGRRKIDTRIQELRLGSQWMDSIQDEGFLATP